MNTAAETLVAIPAYNEEPSIRLVIDGCKKLPKSTIVVFDDSSEDDTYNIATSAGVTVVRNTKNLGYSKNLNKAYLYAESQGYKKIIYIDGDGEHNPKYLNEFQDILEYHAIVLGIRNKLNRWSEYVSAVVSFVRWGIRDPYCGMRGYNIKRINELISDPMPGDKIGTSLFRQVLSLHPNIKIGFVHISVRKREGLSRFGTSFFTEIKLIKNILW